MGKGKAGGREVELLVDQGLRLGNGVIHLISERGEQIFNQRLFCLQCGIGYEPLDPRLFSFNSRQGACSQCSGMGFQWDFDPKLIFADPRKSVSETLKNLSDLFSANASHLRRAMERLLQQVKDNGRIDIDKPFSRLARKSQEEILHGVNGRSAFGGIIPHLRDLRQNDAEDSNQELGELLTETPCTACHGKRLNSRTGGESRWQGDLASDGPVRSGGQRVFCRLALDSGAENNNAERDRAVADKILREIQQRLSFLSEVGLPYLTLDRRADTLSGGEAQRIRLAAQLGSNLRGVCYILDEPTIGLHPRDNAMLLRTLRRLEEVGNSVLVVEHDEATIKSADLIVDLGPGAGVRGGCVVAIGSPQEIRDNPDSLTGAFLRADRKRIGPQREFKSPTGLSSAARKPTT